MKSANDKNKEALTELAWKELIKAIKPRDISVTVTNGIVTLGGSVESYAKKQLAEQIVSNVTGVKAIVNFIEVKLPATAKRTDEEIADEILDAFIKTLNTSDTAAKKEEWLNFNGQVEDQRGQKAAVRGTIRTLEETDFFKSSAVNHPAIITTEEFAYWELFG